MPLQMMSDPPEQTTPNSSYPVAFKKATAVVAGVETEVMSNAFSDKIMITISQQGRLAQWIQVPLESFNADFNTQQFPSSDEDSLLPISHLTPRTLLGGSNTERETIGQLYATQIASAILTRDQDEKRTVLLGLGLSKYEANREVFYDIIDLVMKVL